MSGTLGDFRAVGEAADTEEVAPAVARLLRQACLALDCDAPAARRDIHRALDLLASAPLKTGIQPDDLPSRRRALAPWQVRRVSAHIAANLEAPIRIEDMAGLARLSTSYFFRAFKGSFGMSPHAYVTVRRLARACELLVRSDERLSQIAVACGFADQAHFSRLFHRQMGRAPGVWRREQRGFAVQDPNFGQGRLAEQRPAGSCDLRTGESAG